MSTKLKIDIIEKKNAAAHPKPMHKILPQHEFSMIIVAPKGGGKTNFICNLILKHYKEYFNKILVCSPTVNNDDKWDVVKDTKHVLKRNNKLERALNAHQPKKKVKKIVFKSDDDKTAFKEKERDWDGKVPEADFFSEMDELLPRLAEQQNTIDELRKLGKGGNSKFIADRMLVVLDDQAGMYRGTSFNNPIVNYVIKHRHYSSSCIIVTQAYKVITSSFCTKMPRNYGYIG